MIAESRCTRQSSDSRELSARLRDFAEHFEFTLGALGGSIRDSPHLLEHLVGGLERVQASGNPAVDGRVDEHFLDFVDRHPVVDRPAHVQLDLRRAIERRQHRQVQQAAGLAIEPGTGPRVSPAPLGRDALKRHREIVGRAQRLVDVLGAQDLAAQRQAAIEQLGDRFVSVVAHGHSLWVEADGRSDSCADADT